MRICPAVTCLSCTHKAYATQTRHTFVRNEKKDAVFHAKHPGKREERKEKDDRKDNDHPECASAARKQAYAEKEMLHVADPSMYAFCWNAAVTKSHSLSSMQTSPGSSIIGGARSTHRGAHQTHLRKVRSSTTSEVMNPCAVILL